MTLLERQNCFFDINQFRLKQRVISCPFSWFCQIYNIATTYISIRSKLQTNIICHNFCQSITFSQDIFRHTASGSCKSEDILHLSVGLLMQTEMTPSTSEYFSLHLLWRHAALLIRNSNGCSACMTQIMMIRNWMHLVFHSRLWVLLFLPVRHLSRHLFFPLFLISLHMHLWIRDTSLNFLPY